MIRHPIYARLSALNAARGAVLPGRGGTIFRLSRFGLGLFGLLLAYPVWAQEALQNSLTGQSVSEARDRQMQNPDYTFKEGDFRMLVTPSLAAQWNDNVKLSKSNPEDDFIITPAVGVTASYPLTQRNILYLDVSLGYNWYLNHSDLSALDINSATRTGLSFDIGIKDVTLNLHDWFSYSQDSSQNATVANTGNYGTFNNTVGISADWALNQATLSAGYDHQNELSTSGEFERLNHASEMFFIRSGLQVHPQVTLGAEGTASFTRYDEKTLNDNDAYTVGPYVTFQPGDYFQLTARGGFATYQFKPTSQFIQTSSQNTWYAGLTISHQVRESIRYVLDVGHESSLGVQSDLTEDWYVRPSINWSFIKDWNFNTGLFYQHGKQGLGSQFIGPGNLNQSENYDWYGGNLSLSRAITSRLTLSLDYRLTVRSSNRADNSYTQNLVGLRLTYHPQ